MTPPAGFTNYLGVTSSSAYSVGASDLFIPRATKNRHGMFLELKTLKGKLTRNQIKFIDDMNKEGYYALAAYGSDNAIAIACFLDLTTGPFLLPERN